ncbi:MAG: nicotinate (nicotinamide) nucleotide adenylyltransferase [Gemmatimonadetes bacterium]|nr:nicotinate (nicotinamide) nucleotide adenylyltransferase [Gemmatimonadota bacterium]
MRIGIFGGSFDPVHLGHLAVARRAAARLRLDEVRFVPARVQPLKSAGPRAPAEDRIAMLRAAVGGIRGFVVDGREIARSGPSYTVDTLRELRKERPGDELFLLLGADAARDLAEWRESAELAKLATVVVVPRPGAEDVPAPPGAQKLDMRPIDISATAIRDAVAHGEPMDHLVPEAVADYIAAHGLYRTGV